MHLINEDLSIVSVFLSPEDIFRDFMSSALWIVLTTKIYLHSMILVIVVVWVSLGCFFIYEFIVLVKVQSSSAGLLSQEGGYITVVTIRRELLTSSTGGSWLEYLLSLALLLATLDHRVGYSCGSQESNSCYWNCNQRFGTAVRCCCWESRGVSEWRLMVKLLIHFIN